MLIFILFIIILIYYRKNSLLIVCLQVWPNQLHCITVFDDCESDEMLKEAPNKTFNILSIDGGGLRGIYPAHLLLRIQEELDLNYQDYFDLVIGTSTGSIIAAAIACNIDLIEIIKMYEKYGPKIFPDNGKFGFFSSKIFRRQKNTRRATRECPRRNTFKDIKTPSLIIPSTNICEGTVFVFQIKIF